MTDIERFMSRVNKTDSCWLWNASTDGNGYARFVINRKSVIASRFSYKSFVGEIPNGLFVLHKCDNPKCVNPEHLFTGTQTDNMQDMLKKGRNPRSVKTHCPQGHEYSEQNTYKYCNRRHCKTCMKARSKERYEKAI